LEELIKNNRACLSDAVVVSTQNGVCADQLLKKYFMPEKIISGIVMFGATFYPPNLVVHNFPGELVIGNMFGAPLDKLSAQIDILRKAFRVSVSPNIKGAKYLKIFVNLNNCVPALLGKSIQETFIDIELAQLAILLNREAYGVMQKAGIALGDLPGYPRTRLESMVQMPVAEAAALLSKIMTELSKEPLYGSVLQSIQRGKKSEIDYINGEIVNIAQKNGISAPLNEKIVELVHDVEDAGRFFDKKELLATLEGAI
jgi:2-dehydropantoate 2-reductase